jgi:phenylpropionate dioxygenase-like ring-hydroxylating dioxygenase large terminal subunit
MPIVDNPPMSKDAILDSRVFSDELYSIELDRVFGHSWLFVGHESMIPGIGDYVTNYMGEDSVIVCRDTEGRVRVLLNQCRHRANKVCLFDRGTVRAFTCSYHGWTYNTKGELTGVPFFDEAYFGDLDKRELGLLEPARVSTYGGLIFATWDKDIMSLEDYLGDMRWYLDAFLIEDDLGGLEIIPGRHRYLMPINWKLLAENFAGDSYHFAATHASVIKALSGPAADSRIAPYRNREASGLAEITKGLEYCVAVGHRRGVPHGILSLKIGDQYVAEDLEAAKPVGHAAVEWVMERHRKLQERLKDEPVKPYGFQTANIFPNLSLVGTSSALYGRGLILWHPRGPHQTEVWQWCGVQRNAPQEVKELMAFVLTERQALAGVVAPDDHENFERISENLRAPRSRKVGLHYGMGARHEDEPHIANWPAERLGHLQPRYSEAIQRDFYRYWSTLMGGMRNGDGGSELETSGGDRAVSIPRGQIARGE